MTAPPGLQPQTGGTETEYRSRLSVHTAQGIAQTLHSCTLLDAWTQQFAQDVYIWAWDIWLVMTHESAM